MSLLVVVGYLEPSPAPSTVSGWLQPGALCLEAFFSHRKTCAYSMGLHCSPASLCFWLPPYLDASCVLLLVPHPFAVPRCAHMDLFSWDFSVCIWHRILRQKINMTPLLCVTSLVKLWHPQGWGFQRKKGSHYDLGFKKRQKIKIPIFLLTISWQHQGNNHCNGTGGKKSASELPHCNGNLETVVRLRLL